jgi:hypothetical protein
MTISKDSDGVYVGVALEARRLDRFKISLLLFTLLIFVELEQPCDHILKILHHISQQYQQLVIRLLCYSDRPSPLIPSLLLGAPILQIAIIAILLGHEMKLLVN